MRDQQRVANDTSLTHAASKMDTLGKVGIKNRRTHKGNLAKKHSMHRADDSRQLASASHTPSSKNVEGGGLGNDCSIFTLRKQHYSLSVLIIYRLYI